VERQPPLFLTLQFHAETRAPLVLPVQQDRKDRQAPMVLPALLELLELQVPKALLVQTVPLVRTGQMAQVLLLVERQAKHW
jgi:hypothetical protein